ncbi:MAG: hypothetical protein ACREHG_10205 [Candidatus Saccharimonadales bacterium]
MANPNTLSQNAPVSNDAGAGGSVPFLAGSNHYREQFFQDTVVIGANTQEFVHNITPGGFLRGVRLLAVCTGGTVATAATADNPWNLFSSITLENIDGSPIIYPMGGFAHFTIQKYFYPWNGDPALRSAGFGNSNYSKSINPVCELFIRAEIRDTAGVLANTDARAQYRIRYTINTATQIATGAYTVFPTCTITGIAESWAQPDSVDLHKNSIVQTPDGLCLAAITRHQTLTLNNANADNTLQLSNTGSEIRGLELIVRDSNNVRQDYLTTPVRIRLDNRSMEVDTVESIFHAMGDFYDFLQNGTSTRETGVYVWSRFRRPGDLLGQYWLPTSNATYLMIETSTLGSGVNLPGTVEVITHEVVALSAVPAELEGI